MRFLAAAVSLLLAAPALATPLQVRDANTSQNDMASAIVFAAKADGCSLIQCAGVIASAGCIAAGIAAAQPEVVLGCIAGGAGTVSSHQLQARIDVIWE
jgi:hypothetical protein